MYGRPYSKLEVVMSFKLISASISSVCATTKQEYVADSNVGITGGTFIQFLRGTFTYRCCFFLPLRVDDDSFSGVACCTHGYRVRALR